MRRYVVIAAPDHGPWNTGPHVFLSTRKAPKLTLRFKTTLPPCQDCKTYAATYPMPWPVYCNYCADRPYR